MTDLEHAAEQGVPGAIWKLGRMYADGDGVTKDKARAFEYFRHLTNIRRPTTASARRRRGLWPTRSCRSDSIYLDGIPEP